jgi:hypothetical protein
MADGASGAWSADIRELVRTAIDRIVRSDPSDPLYQAEYEARERYEWARDQLRASLERGDFEAAALNQFSGTLHPVPPSLWRRHDADRMIEKGQAPIPGSRNKGGEANEPKKPLPQAKALHQKAAPLFHEWVSLLRLAVTFVRADRPSDKAGDDVADNSCRNGDIPARVQSVLNDERDRNPNEDCHDPDVHDWRSSLGTPHISLMVLCVPKTQTRT